MSFVTAARDYVEFINANFDSFYQTFGRDMSLFALIKGTLLYLGHSIKIVFLYIVTLQWLRDLAYLPILIPEYTRSIFLETLNLKSLRGTDLGFFGVPTLLQNKFVVGFLNSFFASLPLTFGHFLSTRQLYVNGWHAAAATSVGMLVGHVFFLAAVLFGWRPILIPWLRFESLSYLIAIFITYYTIKKSFGRTAFQKVENVRDAAQNVGIGFLLMVCDQGVLFKYINTLTLGLEPTYLEPLTGTATSITQQHLLYLFGFCLGSICFTFAFFSLAWWFRLFVMEVANWTFNKFAAVAHQVSRVACIAILSISTAFYGIDFFVTRPLGYVPYDRSLIFPYQFSNFSQYPLSTLVSPYTTEDDDLRTLGLPPAAREEDEMYEEDDLAEKYEKYDRGRNVLRDVGGTKDEALAIKKRTSIWYNLTTVFPLEEDANLALFDRNGPLLREVIDQEKFKNSKSVDIYTPETYHIPTSYFWSQVQTRIYSHSVDTKGYGLWKLLFPKDSDAFLVRFFDQIASKKDQKSKEKKSVENRSPQKAALTESLFDRIWKKKPQSSESTKPSKSSKSAKRSKSVTTLEQKRAERRKRLFKTYRAKLWILVNYGSRDIYNQFIHFTNSRAFYDPYDIRGDLTETEAFVVQSIDKIFKAWLDYGLVVDPTDKEAFQQFLEDGKKLDLVKFIANTTLGGVLTESEDEFYQFDDRPFYSRFATVENMTSKIFKGQSQKSGKRNLAIWPFQHSYLNSPPDRQDKAMEQRVFEERLNANYPMKVLFRSDIDSFLKRQPKEQKLSRVMESELFLKRVFMKKMIHSKQTLRRVFQADEFAQEAFAGPKSFANRVYNHQFNGTYRVVRQLLRTDFGKSSNPELQPVTKYDMPLYKDGKDSMTSYHEELFKRVSRKRNPRRRKRVANYSHFIRRTHTRPLYAGWDEDRRALVLTNRFLPTRVSGRVLRLNEAYPQFASLRALAVETKDTKGIPSKKAKGSSKKDNIKRIAFTTWPLTSKVSQDPLLFDRPSVYMADHPNRIPNLTSTASDTEQLAAMNRRLLVDHFIPKYDFRFLEILQEESRKPNVDMKTARRRALNRMKELEKQAALDTEKKAMREAELGIKKKKKKGVIEKPETVLFTTERWPSGFIMQTNNQNIWWLKVKPPRPFVDRGGYVWPGHEQLKINIRHYIPNWENWNMPTFSMKSLSKGTSKEGALTNVKDKAQKGKKSAKSSS